MANTIGDNTNFLAEVVKMDRNTPGDGLLFDNIHQQLVNNDAYLNEELLSYKAENTTKVEAHYILGLTDTGATLGAINACPIGGTVQFKSGKRYTLGSLGTIAKQITIDFNGAEISLDGTGDFIVYQPANSSDRAEFKPPKIINAKFVSLVGSSNFDTIIKIGNITVKDAINTLVEDCKFYHVTANHSLIRNVSGYGTMGDRITVYDCVAPYGLYFNQYSGAAYDGNYSYNNVIRDLDITIFSGIGIAIEGGAISFEGKCVIESCVGGGMKWLGTGTLFALLAIGVYFEANQNFDVYLYNSDRSKYTAVVVTFKNCRHFGNTTDKKIIVGDAVNLKCEDNFWQTGGIYPDVAGFANSYYIGINNACFSAQNGKTGYSNRSELHDTIYTIPHSIHGLKYVDGYTVNSDIINVRGSKIRSYKQDVDAIPAGNYEVGDTIYNKNANTGLKDIGLQCIVRGTQNTISSVTGTGVIGENTIILNNIPIQLTAECIIVVNGVTGNYKVVAIDVTTKALTLDANLASNCTNASVSLLLPEFLSLGTPSYKKSYSVSSAGIQQSNVPQGKYGLLNVANVSDGTMAIFVVSASTANGGKFVTMLSNPNIQFSDVKDNSSTINIYVESGYIQVQNNLATAKTIRYHLGLGL